MTDENEEIHIQWIKDTIKMPHHYDEWNMTTYELEEYYFDGISETITDAIEEELQTIRSKNELDAPRISSTSRR